jgi:hypothetical protein
MKFNKKILIIIIIIILARGEIATPAISPNTTVNNIVEDNNIEIVQQVDTQTNENTLENVVIASKEKEQEEEVSQPEEKKNIVTKYTTTGVNIRAGASLESEIIKTVSINTELQVIESEAEWTEVIEGENIYYIYSKYLSNKKTEIPVTSKSNTERKITKNNNNIETKGSPSSNPLTRSKGVVYYNGHRETWYSQKVLPGGGLKIPGRHVDSRGLVCDGDGYICVASSDLSKGTIVETSLGTGKVYDSGCASGTIDIYCDW